ncbi:Do family serine endopeptidase [uncultured Sphingomonas sp.]|uniref:Do family serine endopeptidase n=1 Tax=uncultured Sphingomonas sp. TaxID=158754 RepID=UPI0035C9455B
MRYVFATTSALLLGGAATALALQPTSPVSAQVAQNEPGAIAAAAPKAGAPMSFADMVARLQPAVVNISTKQTIVRQAQANPFAGTPLGDLFGQMNGGGNGAPVKQEGQALGSGFIISPDGYIVTNNHVIAAAAKGATVDSITVTLTDRKEYTARVVGRDADSDLALLKIDASALPFVRFGDSTRARVGDWVVAIGNPFGLDGTVTAGIVSALHRSTGLGPYDRFIQTDAAINQGNSGGPMFNLNGDVIGINSQILGSQAGGNIGIGFAIPAEEAKPIIDTLMKGGKIARGYMGVTLGGAIDDDKAAALGIPKNQGEIIAGIQPGGPAARAGLRVGDVVTRVNGTAVTPDASLSRLVADVKPGQTARLDVLRSNRPVQVSVTVAARPSQEQLAALTGQGGDDFANGDDDDGSGAAIAPASSNALGLTVLPLTPSIARQVGVDSTVQGVIVAQVDPSTDAGGKFKRSDIIQMVNGTPVHDAAELAQAVAQAKAAGRTQVLLLAQRGKGPAQFVPVKIAKS